MALLGILPLVSLYLMKLIIDTITSGITATDKHAVFKEIAFYIACAGGVALLGDLCHSFASFIKETQSQLITDRMGQELHEKSIAVDLEYYENPQYYNALHRTQSQAGRNDRIGGRKWFREDNTY